MAHRIIQAFGIWYILAITAAYADHVSSNACNTITRYYKEWKLAGSEGSSSFVIKITLLLTLLKGRFWWTLTWGIAA